jgi:hypothetical protein
MGFNTRDRDLEHWIWKRAQEVRELEREGLALTLIVTGAKSFNDKSFVTNVLDRVHRERGVAEIRYCSPVRTTYYADRRAQSRRVRVRYVRPAEIFRVCHAFNIELFAEESCAECGPTVPEAIANELGIPHVQVDLTSEQRAERGLAPNMTHSEIRWHASLGAFDEAAELARQDYRCQVREAYWIDQLEPFRERRVLFLIGGTHSRSLRKRFIAAGIKVQTVHDCWGGSWDRQLFAEGRPV